MPFLRHQSQPWKFWQGRKKRKRKRERFWICFNWYLDKDDCLFSTSIVLRTLAFVSMRIRLTHLELGLLRNRACLLSTALWNTVTQQMVSNPVKSLELLYGEVYRSLRCIQNIVPSKWCKLGRNALSCLCLRIFTYMILFLWTWVYSCQGLQVFERGSCGCMFICAYLEVCVHANMHIYIYRHMSMDAGVSVCVFDSMIAPSLNFYLSSLVSLRHV